MTLSIHHSPLCDIRIPGARWFHPFDGKKWSRAVRLLEAEFGSGVGGRLRPVSGPLSDADLGRVHTPAYLHAMRNDPKTVARALEVRPLAWLGNGFIQHRIITPMLFAAAGTLAAARKALTDGGTAICLGGGFHHAHADHGEGFCLIADIPIAVRTLVAEGRLAPTDRILVIDLDAHRGNGFEAICRHEPVEFFDIYNAFAYPGFADEDTQRFPYLIPTRTGDDDAGYLGTLNRELPEFLDRFATGARLAFYNAGTDILVGDRLGGLSVSAEGVRERDRLVFAALRARRIPTVMVTSGGYTDASHRCIATAVADAIRAEQ